MVVSLAAPGWHSSTSATFRHQNAMAGLGAILACFELSLRPVSWLMIPELYPLRVRSQAMAAATMVDWTFNFLVSYFFLTMTTTFGRDGTLWLFGFIARCALVFGITKVPETRGRSWRRSSRNCPAILGEEARQAA